MDTSSSKLYDNENLIFKNNFVFNISDKNNIYYIEYENHLFKDVHTNFVYYITNSEDIYIVGCDNNKSGIRSLDLNEIELCKSSGFKVRNAFKINYENYDKLNHDHNNDINDNIYVKVFLINYKPYFFGYNNDKTEIFNLTEKQTQLANDIFSKMKYKYDSRKPNNIPEFLLN